VSGKQDQQFSVDITNCDREPIHILGTIQPFGFLIALSADWLISRVSVNIEDHIGIPHAQMLGKPLSDFFEEDALHAIRNRIAMLRDPDAVERLFGIVFRGDRPPFDVAVHFSGQSVVIEAEPAVLDEVEAGGMVRSMIARLAKIETMTAFLREGARHLRALTGFDRVMIYRFDRTGSGEVAAEALRPGIDSFLGLNYPASDIPAQARALYLRNLFRIIADVRATPIPLAPAVDAGGTALDQSLSVLRAVSPIHIEYLRNMGVDASLSISIVVDGKLWGLFACHHYAPRLPSFAQRSGAELFGQMFSMMLESRERREAAEYETRARMVADRLMATVAQDSELLNNAQWLGEIIFDTIQADGVVVYIDGALSLSGLTPDRKQFDDIVSMLNRTAASQVFTTDQIASLVPSAADYASRAAGLLAIPLSRRPRDYVVLFRVERLRSVRWAGNPDDKKIEYGPNGPRLTPRKSFEEWSDLARGKAVPFTQPELRVAETLRVALLEVVLRLSESAGQERRKAHEQQELLIAELNHRVRNILALIRGLISQTRQSSLSAESFIETLDDRVQALARAHDQITADRWGPARLVDLIETESGAYLGARRDRIKLKGPNVLLEPSSFTVLALVFHELMTNAAKYGALSDSGTVWIEWRIDDDGSMLISWRETGGPAVTAPTRRGFGSTIIERSIPYDLNGKADIRYRLSGLEAEFCIPARYIARVLPDAAMPAAQPPAAPAATRMFEGMTVLLVEDNMIIALDSEDALHALGAIKVQTTATVQRANELAAAGGIDFAVLDFNLGSETSLPVADLLLEKAVPFIFATGYGDGLDLPKRFEAIPLVKKPFNMDSLAKAISAADLVEARKS
jgi:light-regulated signal transduction histidine kinase (bacteriophytochrome)/CheY-like chemotaxis protein